MRNLLTSYLKRFGVSSYEELNEEERKTYREWEIALSGRELTATDVRAYLDRELDAAITSLTTKQLGERDDTFLKMKVEFIRSLTSFLDSPRAEKKAVEQLLAQQQT